ncbi:protein kinase [bacterium]|nr:protein kinase [bacterium]
MTVVAPDPPPLLPAPDTDVLRAAVERCADEMVSRWKAGERPSAETYYARYPGLRSHPALALELVAEEIALRAVYGPPATRSELARRFPEWAAQAQAVFDYHQALAPLVHEPRFPEPGEVLGEFHIGPELGRGANGRVYLATQPDLGDRPVVVKFAPDDGGEHLSLARLQHTHIVPLYSAHDFPERGLRGLCLPYFGGATLADLLARVDRDPTGPLTGRSLSAALGTQTQPSAQSSRGPARGILEAATLSGALCWIGACLADALQYAHERGVLHLDLKPSNVLLAADGVPMLLDFHLARPPLRAADPPPLWVGGTPEYMPPEQDALLRAVRDVAPVPADVDPRADVFALGRLLSEALARVPREVTPGLAAVLARATAPSAADRYPSAAAFGADLRRHLSDQPLAGVRNRSVRERWSKWRRRRPHAPAFVLLLAVLGGTAAALVWAGWRQLDRARVALQTGESHLDHGRYLAAAEAARQGESALDGLPLQPPLLTRLRVVREKSERGLVAAELHQFAEKIRPLYAVVSVPAGDARVVAGQCRRLWERRETIAQAATGPAGDRDGAWRTDLLDVGVITALLESAAAPSTDGGAGLRRALVTLDEAEATLGPSGVLYLERARVARALGLDAVAEGAVRRAAETPPRTAWEHLAAARSHLGDGDAARAAAEVERCLATDPGSFWGNYYLGLCSLRLNRPVPAVAAFSACAARAPDSAWCVFNRGLAFAQAGDPDRAVADFDRALVLDPSLTAALIGRAAAHQVAGRTADALSDLNQAESRGVPRAEVRYRQGHTLLLAGDRSAAATRLRESLAADPTYQAARELLTRIDPAP